MHVFYVGLTYKVPKHFKFEDFYFSVWIVSQMKQELYCEYASRKKTPTLYLSWVWCVLPHVLQGSGCGATQALGWTRGSLWRQRCWVYLAARTVLSTTPLWVIWCYSRAPATSCSTFKLWARRPIIHAGWKTGPACRRAPTGRWHVRMADFTCSKTSTSGGLTPGRCGSPKRASGPKI